MNNIRTKPFLSRAQLRKCYALRRAGLRTWDCDKWAKETENIRKLPKRLAKKGHDGLIYSFWPDFDLSMKIANIAQEYLGDYADPSFNMHLTLQYVGKANDYAQHIDKLLEAQLDLALYWVTNYGCKPVEGVTGGVVRFPANDEGMSPICLIIDSEELFGLKEQISRKLSYLDIKSDGHGHGFIPHITLGYIPQSDPTPNIQIEPIKVAFNDIVLACGDYHVRIPLTINPDASMSTKAVWSTAFINDLPDSSFLFIESGGKKDESGKTTPRSKRHFPYKDSKGKIDLPHLRNAIARIPQSNAPGLNKTALQKRARSILMTSNKTSSINAPDTSSGMIVFKDANNQYRWVVYSSNPYKDRDGEFVTLKAHEADIAELEITGEYGPLRWWHEGSPYFDDPKDWRTVRPGPGLDVGMCDFAAMHGRIRIESGTFKSEKIGRAFAKHAKNLEISQGFAHPETEPDDGNGFLHIKTFERSLTPRGQASNLFTSFMVSSKEIKMNPGRKAALEALGVDIDEVLQGAEQIQRKADSKKAPFREKARASGNNGTSAAAIADDDDEDGDVTSISSKLDMLTAQLASLKEAMKDEGPDIQEEKLEDLMVSELTVGEFQDIVKQTVSRKSLEPIGQGLKLIMDEMAEIKEILTSKSVQSVVDEVGRMKAKLERLSARTKGIGSKVRELADEEPRGVRQKGVRPSEDDATLFDDLDDADIAQKTSNNPFAWVDEFIQKQ